MRRIPPYIGTDGDLRSGRVHGEDARHNRGGNMQPPPRRGHREARGWACINHTPIPPVFERTGQADGDLRSGRVHGEDTGMIGGGTGGTIRGATCNPLLGGGNPTQGSIRRTLDFGGVRK